MKKPIEPKKPEAPNPLKYYQVRETCFDHGNEIRASTVKELLQNVHDDSYIEILFPNETSSGGYELRTHVMDQEEFDNAMLVYDMNMEYYREECIKYLQDLAEYLMKGGAL